MTSTNLVIVTILMARLGYAHGVQRVPIGLDDAVRMTTALGLDRALATLQTSAIIGAYAMDDAALGAHASPFGAALHFWLTAVLAGYRGLLAEAKLWERAQLGVPPPT